MRLAKPGMIRIAALFAALFMVAAGLILCRLEPPLASSAAATPTASTTAEGQPQPDAEEPGPQAPAPSEDVASPSGQTSPQSTKPDETPPVVASKPQEPIAATTNKRAAPPRKAVPQAYLPPFQPGLYAAPTDGPSGPPSNVLWLSGVIQGDPKLAILRQGENRYLVREGDALDNGYRVVQISTNNVTLNRRGKNRVLRLGQY